MTFMALAEKAGAEVDVRANQPTTLPEASMVVLSALEGETSDFIDVTKPLEKGVKRKRTRY